MHDAIRPRDEILWYKELWDDSKNPRNGNKLRFYRRFKSNLLPEQYVKSFMPRYMRRVMAMLRCGSMPLCVETGRFNNTPLCERICNMCNNGNVEDEMHFLFECDVYSDLRFAFKDQLDILGSSLTNDEKLFYLMTQTSLEEVNSMGKMIFKMFTRRKKILR